MIPSQFEQLTQINLDDLVSSFGWHSSGLPARLLRRIFLKPAQSFAGQMTEFDRDVGDYGLAEGARRALRKYIRHIRVYDADLIPAGGFLALSNHPGMSDSLSAFVALNRPDVRIIAMRRPFLEALSCVSRQLFYVTEAARDRMSLVRQVSTHLRNGGAVLTYPAGEIEPDPDVHSDAVDSLQMWTDSVGVFIRMAPATPILPMLIRGVVSEKSLRHPLTYIKRTREEREKLAAALQLFAHLQGKIEDVQVRVQIGKPIYTKDLGSTDTQVIHQAVLTEMKGLIENPPQGEGVSAL